MLNAGSTAWVLASAALVMLMTPGLAFFYGGMVRSRSVLNMLMMNFMCLAIVAVLWCLYGFSLTFGNDSFAGLIGNFQFLGLGNAPTDPIGTDPDKIPLFAFAMFQLMFAVITPALISGAIPDRAKFWGWGAFVVLWSTFVYFPVATGCSPSTATTPRRAAGSPTTSRRSTSPAGPRSTSTPAPRASLCA